MSWPRALATWLFIIIAESVHGVVRELFLAPRLGDLPARQVGVLVGSAIIFTTAWACSRWIGARTLRLQLAIGFAWVVLTVAFEVALGTALGLTPDRMLADYDLARGGLMGFGLLFMLVAPALATLFFPRSSTPGIDAHLHPGSLAVLEPVVVNGTRQWVLIRSENVAHPVVLFVHGGPGTSQLTLMRRNTRALEKYFTVVNWDQRGAGKSFRAGGDRAGMHMGQFVDDIVDLSSRLAARFHKDKILLVGHSWGSAIGMLAAAKRPDLFSAYVGIGQTSNLAASELLSYEWTLEQAQRAADASSVDTLTSIGPPPYIGNHWRSKFLTQRRVLAKHGGEYYGSSSGAFGVVLKNLVFSREYTMVDRINYFRGVFQSLDALFPELLQTNLFVQVPKVQIPVYFCLGRHDYEVPAVLSVKYFEALQAPGKQLVWFERSSHFPNTEERDKFNAFMIDTVLPALPERNGGAR